MIKENNIDHLFRHQHGQMVSILTRIFGLEHFETIEDAVQDTFVQAMLSWRNKVPEHPEAWLMQAAKNRVIDIFRKLSAERKRTPKIESGSVAMSYNELFLEDEIADSQLRMVFTACHPSLNPKDQISFALKTISGFSRKEIAAALLLKEETVKKRLLRARQFIKKKDLSFEIPKGKTLSTRLIRVQEVLYLIFNEGFHSNSQNAIIRKDLCGEAMRLCQMLLGHQLTKQPQVYALFALMCFQAARLDSKLNEKNEIIDLKKQDRSLWYRPLIFMGHEAMYKAVEDGIFSRYHFEAAIAAEHLKAKKFESTNWDSILHWYQKLNHLLPSAMTQLNIAMVQIQRKEMDTALNLLQEIDSKKLEQRSYLYHGAFAEYFAQTSQPERAITYLDKAISSVINDIEKQYLLKKKARLEVN